MTSIAKRYSNFIQWKTDIPVHLTNSFIHYVFNIILDLQGYAPINSKKHAQPSSFSARLPDWLHINHCIAFSFFCSVLSSLWACVLLTLYWHLVAEGGHDRHRVTAVNDFLCNRGDNDDRVVFKGSYSFFNICGVNAASRAIFKLRLMLITEICLSARSYSVKTSHANKISSPLFVK